MGLGSILFKQDALLGISRRRQDTQAQSTSANRDFVVQYLRCLGVNELDRVPEALRGVGVGGDAVRCIEELMRSTSWDELFTKVNLEIALLETTAKREVQRLIGGGNSSGSAPLALSATYNFVLSIAMIRYLLSNESTRPIALATLSKMAYMLFDLLMELTKHKIIPPNLEVEIWRVREVLVNVMEELFKGDRTMTVNDKSFDKNK